MNGEEVLLYELGHFTPGQFPAQHVFGDVGGEVFPTQSELRVVLEVQGLKDLPSLFLRQGHFDFVGGLMNVGRIPDQGHFVGPIPVEDFECFGLVLENRSQLLHHVFDQVGVHVSGHLHPSAGIR